MRNTATLRAAQAQVPAYVTSVGRRPRSAAGDAAQLELVPLGERLLADRHRVVLDGRQATQALLVVHFERSAPCAV